MRISDWSSDVCSSDLIGGVLEPLQAGPVVIEDGAFIGARAEVAEGVIVREGAVLSMGVYLGASTKIVDRATGETFIGEVPPYAVVVPGSLPGKPLPDGTQGPSLYCAGGHASSSEEHTSELQSLMRISYAVFCLKKKKI